jgi:hypothetical protein
MIYSHKGYKTDNNGSLILLNLQLRDCYTQYRCNGNLKTSRNWDLVYVYQN